MKHETLPLGFIIGVSVAITACVCLFTTRSQDYYVVYTGHAAEPQSCVTVTGCFTDTTAEPLTMGLIHTWAMKIEERSGSISHIGTGPKLDAVVIISVTKLDK